MEYRGSGDERIGASLDGQSGVFTVLSAINLDPGIESLCRAEPAQFSNLRHHLGRNFCPPKPGLTVITNTTSQRCSTCSTKAIGAGGIQYRAGLLAKLPDSREHTVEMDRRRRLALN